METQKAQHIKKIVRVVGVSVLVVSLLATTTSSQAASQATVGLGTASTYAVLAGSAVTNTGPTTFSGSAGSDLGIWPGTSISGEGPGADSITKTGTTHNNDAAAQQAQSDLTIAYNDAAGRTPATTVTGDLGGQTLLTGTYNSASSLGLTGTLTLNAEGDPSAVFVFQAGTTLTTASTSTVSLINGAQACNVFWQIGSSATLGTASTLVGHVLALTSISATTGATVQGSLLARNGSVTLDTNTITNDLCAAVVTPTPTPTATATTPTATTTTGGTLPDTGSDYTGLAVLSVILIAGGTAALRMRKQYE